MLRKRQRRFPLKREDGSSRDALLKGFHAPQRDRVRLPADAKPQRGVSQPMPDRKAKAEAQ